MILRMRIGYLTPQLHHWYLLRMRFGLIASVLWLTTFSKKRGPTKSVWNGVLNRYKGRYIKTINI